MDEKSEPREKKSPPPPPPEEPSARRLDVVVRGASTRCPHCHDAVSPENEAWAACRACLARHHLDCWGEGGACAACGEKRFITSVPARTPARERSGSSVARIVLSAGVALLLGAALVIQDRSAAALRDENAKLRRELESARADAPPKKTETKAAPEGITARTFTERENREFTYRHLGGKDTTVSVVAQSTLDYYAIVVAKHVIAGDEILENRDGIVRVLEKVQSVMADDPGRKEEFLLLEKALAILEKR